MENQLSLHLTAFNNRVKVMNQTNSKSITLTAMDARNLHNDIFELLAQIAVLTATKEAEEAAAEVNIEMDGGGF